MKTLSLKDASAFLNMSSSALRAKAKAGEIPGAKIGKRWVFIDVDLASHIRSRYAISRQALRVTTMEKPLCYTNATTRGGLDLVPPTEREYDALLTQPTKRKRKSSMTNSRRSIGDKIP